MLNPSNTPDAARVDKMLKHSNIEDMLETTNASAAQIAIEYLDRMTAAKGITKETLAKRTGVTRQTIAARFNKRSMDLECFVATADAININPGEILSRAIRLKQDAIPALAGGAE